MDSELITSQKRYKVRKKVHNDNKIGTGKRKERKTSSNNNCIVCPACTVTVRGDKQIEQHYQQEIQKMEEPFNGIDSKKKQYKMRLRSQSKNEENTTDNDENPLKTLEKRNEVFKEIQKRKYGRFADMFQFSMKRTKLSSTVTTNHDTVDRSITTRTEIPSSYELISCAVCNEFVESGTTSTEHLAKCFAKHDYQYELYSSDENSDEETVEEFSWAEQTWIRTSSLMENSDFGQEGRLTRLVMDDGDEELDIDGDTEFQFGKQQFSEKDVIPCSSVDSPQTTLAAEETNLSTNTQNILCDKLKIEKAENCSNTDDNLLEETKSSRDEDPCKIIELLKKKVSELEGRLDHEVYKCPICMGPYVEPVISINCWHASCSECWLRVLGAKKMCPKCNEIVTPSQLRKIFL